MPKLKKGLFAGLMLVWGGLLTRTDAYYLPYLLLLLGGFAGLLSPGRRERLGIPAGCTAGLFSLLITLANYRIWYAVSGRLGKLLVIAGLLAGGLAVWTEGLRWLLPRLAAFSLPREEGTRDRRFFWIPFCAFVLVELVILFLCRYPGILTDDSVNQINQILSGSYSNHHPFYHTQLIRLFVLGGQGLFGSLAAGIACYSVFQILVMGAVFSYVPYTLRVLGLKKSWIIAMTLLNLLMPYHLTFAVTLWKDILFGVGVLLLCLTLYRRLTGLAARRDLPLLVLSGFVMCLFRSNGFLAFALTTLGFALLFGKKERKLLLLFVAVLLISWGLKNPVLKLLEVPQPDTVEALSVPLQQLARVIYEEKELLPEEEALLRELVSLETVRDVYRVYISDPVKNAIRDQGNQAYFSEHKLEYLKLYLAVGLRNPWEYVRAYVDQTRGYYNSGYSYWYYAKDSLGRELGIDQSPALRFLNRCLNGYLRLFELTPLRQLVLSIGLSVWLLFLLLLVALRKRDRLLLLLDFPLLAILLSLLIATPVFSEFRYLYALFCAFPFLPAVHFIGGNAHAENCSTDSLLQ